MFCNNCGHRNPLGSHFCSSCGVTLGTAPGDPSTITFQIESIGGTEEGTIGVDEIAANGVLVVTRGPNAGSSFVLESPRLTVGRHPEGDIFLDDVTVSRHHVELIRQDGGGYLVRDVGSLNGTYLNRERIDEAPLHRGDELQIGRFKLLYLESGDDG